MKSMIFFVVVALGVSSITGLKLRSNENPTSINGPAQVIQGFQGEPLKVQFWDATYHYNETEQICYTGLVGIQKNMDQKLAPKHNNDRCPNPLGHVTPCKLINSTDTYASGAVAGAPSLKLTTNIQVKSKASCLNIGIKQVRQAGAVWYQDIESLTQGTGTAANYFYFNSYITNIVPTDQWGGVQFSWQYDQDGKKNGMKIVATGGGKYSFGEQKNLFLCKTSTYDPESCIHSSIWGKEYNNEFLPHVLKDTNNGAYNIYFVTYSTSAV